MQTILSFKISHSEDDGYSNVRYILIVQNFVYGRFSLRTLGLQLTEWQIPWLHRLISVTIIDENYYLHGYATYDYILLGML